MQPGLQPARHGSRVAPMTQATTERAGLRRGLPPGPKVPALVQAIRFGRAPYEYLAECAREVGDPFTLRMPGDPPRIVFSDPALVRQVFAMRADDIRLEGQAFPLNLGERALLFLDGERHRRD